MGRGKRWEGEIEGGVVGVIVDGRGRPLQLPKEDAKRMEKIKEWNYELNVYPERGGE